jgi:hypothetical protein
MFRYALARQRTRTLFAVGYPVAIVVVLGIASSLGFGAVLVAIVVLAVLPKAILSAKGRRL